MYTILLSCHHHHESLSGGIDLRIIYIVIDLMNLLGFWIFLDYHFTFGLINSHSFKLHPLFSQLSVFYCWRYGRFSNRIYHSLAIRLPIVLLQCRLQPFFGPTLACQGTAGCPDLSILLNGLIKTTTSQW